MTRKNIWVAGMAAPVMIAMLLLFVGSPRVAAVSQDSKANAEVKSIISSLGHRHSRYPSERQLPGQIKMTFRIRR
jgi:hypothetical protein